MDNIEVSEEVEDNQPPAILFELENIAVNGRQATFDALKKALKSKDVAVTPLMFSRYCLHMSPRHYVAELLKVTDRERLSAEKIVEQFLGAVQATFFAKDLKIIPSVKKALLVAREKEAKIGALSASDTETGEALVKALKIADMVTHVDSYANEEKSHPSVDAWLRLARDMATPPSLCIAVVTCSMSCKAAISAGMRCVAVPDAFTSFQDFGGADFVVDKMDDTVVTNILDIVNAS